MKNFVAYHKVAEWGPYESDSRTKFRHYSGHPQSKLQKTIGQNVWVISGTKVQQRTRYKLCAVYQPTHIEALPEGGFVVVGEGTEFNPQIDLSETSWIGELLKEQRNFSYGLNDIRSSRVVGGLQSVSQEIQDQLGQARLGPNEPKDARKLRSVPDSEMVIRRLVPAQYWIDVIETLGASIELAHLYGPDRWGIRLASDSVMLKVGRHEILQIGDWDLPFHLIVDRTSVPPSLRKITELRFSEDMDCYGNYSANGYYASNPSSEACDMPFGKVRLVYQKLRDSHVEVIARAAQQPKHSSTRSTHSVGLIQFLSKELGRSLPQPAYSDVVKLTLIPEEITDDEQYIEGSIRQIQVNAYERDRKARQRCIEYYGTRCYICDMSFGEYYGAEAAGIIHVHHLVPLHEIGESYQVAPITDLRPICPNCHAVIHATKPARTIEQVRRMLQRT